MKGKYSVVLFKLLSVKLKKQIMLVKVRNLPKTKFHLGFTLIEIIVVIAILGVLSAVLISVINPLGQLEKTRDSARKNDLAIVSRALEAYAADYGGYPDVPGGSVDSSNPNWLQVLVDRGYLKSLPKDPKQANLIGSNLVSIFKQFFSREEQKLDQQGNVAGLSTLYFGNYVNTGTLGFEPKLDPKKYNLSFSAGYILRQQWSKMEPQDDVFNWTYLDGALTELKAAGKRGSIRLAAGPSSPDWLRTGNNQSQKADTICWYQSSGAQGATWNCFPWMWDPIYQAERKETLENLYRHYTVDRPDLGSAVSFVTLPIPSHIRSAEAAHVRNKDWIVYLDPSDDSGVPIGIYCNTDFPDCPEEQIKALPTSTFANKGYTKAKMYKQLSDSILDAYAAMPTWYIGIMHAHESNSPPDLVQNNYETIKNNNLVDRVMMGFTWLDEYDSLHAAEQNVYNDLKLNFYEATGGNGKVGWQPNVSSGNTLLDAWCQLGAPLESRWLEVGGSNQWVEGSDLETIFENPDCAGEPSPEPSPAEPSPSPTAEPSPVSSVFKYLYEVTADLQSLTLWATLENLDDPEIYNKPGAKCPRVPPPDTSYNFCIGL